ncbi:MAG: putative inositol monophosphatase [Ilumatobacteraceae bacterium]|nr:putative inositol monophosphatase [Ilumatobacteraceae bacterium]
MALVVDVESVVDRMTLHVGDESGDIDDSQWNPLWIAPPLGNGAKTTLLSVFRDVVALFSAIADEVGQALRSNADWGPSGQRDGQYSVDLVADDICLRAIATADLSVLSEESGLTLRGDRPIVIVDPLDGSTNASHGVPWFATSLCLADADGLAVGLVRNQATGVTYSAVRGEGAWLDGTRLHASACVSLDQALVGLSGMPPSNFGWRQFRAFGASALDLCLVAGGVLDGFVDCSVDAHGVWDYAAATLICAEAGAAVVDGPGRDLIVRDPALKRTPVAAGTPELLAQLVAARRAFA